MSKTIYDIFISYRRDGGDATAGRINDLLTADGYSVSYDVDTLREGRFDYQLLERIEQCQDFILVVDKNCFARTIDPSTDKLDDWLWQELSYALKLKKNIIPILLVGADFPKNLPKDIDSVRKINGPKCVHEYFDEFYKRLRDDFLRAYPRLAKPSNVGQPLPTKNMACLKLKADIDCIFYLDGEECSHLQAGIIQKIQLAKGEYELMFVSEENGNDRLEMEFEMPDVDKLQKVILSNVRNARLQKEAEENRIAEEKRQAEEKRKKDKVEVSRIIVKRICREEEEPVKEKMFTIGGVSFKMIRVEGGNMGTFYIGETQVTQALWKAVMGNNSSHFKGEDHPVECVSWNDICGKDGTGTDPNCFLYKLNQKTGMKYRLPKELEWEYAAKGGNKSKGYTYAGSDNIDEVVWYWKNSGDKYLEGSDSNWDWEKIEKNNSKTHSAKQLSPNELGIYDMSGNVWEWCQDLDSQGGDYRVSRGGGWDYNAAYCCVANRDYDTPTNAYDDLGLRLAQ